MSDHSTSLGHEEVAWESNVSSSQSATEKKYKCPQCPSSFKRPENLKRHLRGHDERVRFTCQICDKSFARSDILGRHAAIHVEQRDDNPHRRRACRECARVRERCSRGEPCRRCAIKALCCLYPEESRFKITIPQTWSSSTPEPDYYDGTGASSTGPDPTPKTRGGGLLRDPGPSQLQTECPQQSVLSPAAVPHHPYLASPDEGHFASFFGYDALSFQDECFYGGSASDITTGGLKLITDNIEPDGLISGVYNQTASMSLVPNLDPVGGYLPSPPFEFQGQYTEEAQFDGGYFENTFGTSSSGSGTHPALYRQPEALDFSGIQASQEGADGAQYPSIDFDSRESQFHTPRTPYSPW